MNKKLGLLSLMIFVGCVMSSKSFADGDYRSRNVFNRMSDWSATIGRTGEDKQRIIHERVAMRAKKRESTDQYYMQDKKVVNSYNEHVNDLNANNAKYKIDNDRTTTLNAWQKNANKAKKHLNNEKDDLKQAIKSKIIEENKNFQNAKADLLIRYKDNVDAKNEKLKDLENEHEMRMSNLNDQWKMKEERNENKEHRLNKKLNQEKSGIDHDFDMKKEEVKEFYNTN